MESNDAHSEPDRSFTELFGELAAEVGSLVQQELAAAADEMAQKAREAARDALLVVAGVLLGAVSLLVLTGALVLALGSTVPMWAAALVIAIVIGLAGYILFKTGSSRIRAIAIVPSEALASIADDGTLVRQQIAATRDQMVTTMGEVRSRLELPAKPKKRRAPAKKPAR